jgi:WD40 repeat protein
MSRIRAARHLSHVVRYRVFVAVYVGCLVLSGCGASAPLSSAGGRGGATNGGGAGGAGSLPVDQSEAWTWRACGSIKPGPAAKVARFSPSGRQVYVKDERGAVTLYDVAGQTAPLPIGPIDGALVYAPDDTLFVRASDPSPRIVLQPVAGTGPTFIFEYPQTDAFCDSEGSAFSPNGEYFYAANGQSTCVWRVVDEALVAATYGSRTAVNDETLVMLTPDVDSAKNAEIVTRSFGGAELGRVRLAGEVESSTDLVLSPAGDRVAGSSSGRLWDAATGAEILPTSSWPRVPLAIFSGTGEAVLVGDGVFRTRDAARIATLPRFSRIQWALDLAPDGRQALGLQFGDVAALSDVSAPGVVRMLGSSTINPAKSGSQIESLEISADGEILVMGTRYWASFAYRLAPRFEDSTLLSSMRAWLATLSADGRFAASSGDARVIYDVRDGALLFVGPEAGPAVCRGVRLRPSPSGQWAAGAGFEGKLDVFSGFSRASVAADPWQQPFVSLPAGCFDTAAFTNDEQLMATSEPALYRTGSAPEDWQRIWRRQGSALGGGGLSGESYATNDVVFSPDETRLLVSRCSDDTCDVRIYDVADVAPPVMLPALTAPHPSFSPGGEWIVDAGTLLHLRSGEVRALDPAADISVALFAPNGDVIAGGAGGIVTRYCRAP